MKVADFFDTLLNLHQPTWRHTPEDSNLDFWVRLHKSRGLYWIAEYLLTWKEVCFMELVMGSTIAVINTDSTATYG